jgi:soluble lytic murein transglycosylase-like protein
VKLRVERWAVRAGVPERLALAVAWIESGYQSDVRSVTGDWGPMQVSPPAWDFIEGVILGRAVPHTTNGNIRVGVLYLRRLLREFQGDTRLAVAAYHQGVASVREVGVLPKTASYVAAVEAVAVRA